MTAGSVRRMWDKRCACSALHHIAQVIAAAVALLLLLLLVASVVMVMVVAVALQQQHMIKYAFVE